MWKVSHSRPECPNNSILFEPESPTRQIAFWHVIHTADGIQSDPLQDCQWEWNCQLTSLQFSVFGKPFLLTSVECRWTTKSVHDRPHRSVGEDRHKSWEMRSCITSQHFITFYSQKIATGPGLFVWTWEHVTKMQAMATGKVIHHLLFQTTNAEPIFSLKIQISFSLHTSLAFLQRSRQCLRILKSTTNHRLHQSGSPATSEFIYGVSFAWSADLFWTVASVKVRNKNISVPPCCGADVWPLNCLCSVRGMHKGKWRKKKKKNPFNHSTDGSWGGHELFLWM